MKIREYEELDDENFYLEDAREILVEDDEITPREAGFMRGWDEAGEWDE